MIRMDHYRPPRSSNPTCLTFRKAGNLEYRLDEPTNTGWVSERCPNGLKDGKKKELCEVACMIRTSETEQRC